MARYRPENQVVTGMYVEVRNNDVNRAMRKLKKMCNNEGIIRDVREKEYFEKPSIKKKKAKAKKEKTNSDKKTK